MEISRLAGRFSKVEKIDENTVIVGLVGNVSATSLSEAEKEFIAAFYIKGFPTSVELVSCEVLKDYQCKPPYHTSNYNGGFIKLTARKRG